MSPHLPQPPEGRPPRGGRESRRHPLSGPDAATASGQLEALFLNFAPKVYRLALRCGLDAQEAEDGVQEVFLKVRRRLHTFRGEAALSTWLYQVALNTLRDHRRRVVRQTRPQPLSLITDERGELNAHDPMPLPPELAAREERRLLVREALDRLPAKFRQVLILRELEGLSYRDIARVLDLAQGTVESRIFRARERLARELLRRKEDL